MIRRLLFAAALLPCASLRAQSDTAASPAAAAQQAAATVPPSRLEFYAGLRANGGTNFMMGAKYSHRRPDWGKFGAGGFLEVVFASQTEFLLGALAQFYPTPRLLIETGPGFAFDGGSEFFWRLGAEYELQLARWSVTPQFYLDFINGTTVFGYGVAIGRRR